MRRYWQAIMIALATSERLKRFMQARRSLSSLATRFVGGRTAKEAVETANSLASRGIRSSLFYLGEYVDTDDLVHENVEALEQVAECLSETELDIHISVDPTQVGCSINWNKGCIEVSKIGEKVRDAASNRSGVHCLMLDMEDFGVNEKTLALHESLRVKGVPVAQTLRNKALGRTSRSIIRLGL